MKPSLSDLEVIATGEYYSDDESECITETEFYVVEQQERAINYDSDMGYPDIEYTYIIKHPDHPEYWRFIYVHCSWDDGDLGQPEQVVKRAKMVEVWETI
jgi:hypothetical protein